jgi:hypothetical protein
VPSPALNIVTGALADGDDAAAVEELLARRAEVVIPMRACHADTQADIIERWAEAHELLDLLLELSDAVVEVAHSGQSGLRSQILGDIFFAGQAVAREVLTLLRTGHATGALARWRAVHELATRAEFLSRWGQTVDGTLERYRTHDRFFREYRSTKVYQAWMRRFHPDYAEPGEKLRSLELEREGLADRFGSAFLGDYGWAHEALCELSVDYRRQVEKGKRVRGPVFDDLDRAVRFESDEAPYKWRYLYEESNAAVHGVIAIEEQLFRGLLRMEGLSTGSPSCNNAAHSAVNHSPAGESTAARIADLTRAAVALDWSAPTLGAATNTYLLLETVSSLAGRTEAAFFAPAHSELSREDDR